MKILNWIIVILFFCLDTKAQNALSGVYVRYPIVIGGDSVYSQLQGRVIDSLTFKPIINARIDFFTSRGDALAAITDSTGYFRINALPSGSKIVVVCVPDSLSPQKIWRFNTEGMSDPIQLSLYFYYKKEY